MAATVQVDSDHDPNKKTCFKHVVVIWEKKNGVDLTNELVDSLPLKKNGLVVKDKQAFMTHKNKTTKDNELWEGRVRKLCGKFTLVTFSDKFKAWQPYIQVHTGLIKIYSDCWVPFISRPVKHSVVHFKIIKSETEAVQS